MPCLCSDLCCLQSEQEYLGRDLGLRSELRRGLPAMEQCIGQSPVARGKGQPFQNCKEYKSSGHQRLRIRQAQQLIILFSSMSQIQQKDSSMVSTHISKNQSACESGFFDAEMRKSAMLEYANKPMSKELPRWTQSAATWRHTSHRYSFSKDKRFKDERLNYSDILEPTLPSTNNLKSCTFGKGGRKPISQVVLRNAKQKPSPNAYDMERFNESPRSARYGKTFGIGWSNFERVHIPHRKDVYSGHFTQDNPPAHYEIREIPGQHKRAFSTYGRLKMFTQQMAEVTRGNPPAHHVIKDRHLQNTVGLHERSFGFGERLDLTAPANDFPGAVYLIPGFADKFRNTKRKVTPRNKL